MSETVSKALRLTGGEEAAETALFIERSVHSREGYSKDAINLMLLSKESRSAMNITDVVPIIIMTLGILFTA